MASTVGYTVGQCNFATLSASPTLLPADHDAEIPTQGLARTVADYIAGMTDAFIHHLWSRRCPR
jgi:dGTPase